MKMVPLTYDTCEETRKWRNDDMQSLRTPFMNTLEMQEDFYEDIVCDPASPHRYFGFIYETVSPIVYLGMGGITNIQWENRIGEISLIISPEHRRIGWGKEAAYMLYAYAFDTLNLYTVYGEVYRTNSLAENFWLNLFPAEYFTRAYLPNRKYWDGKYWQSVYFSISQPEYKQWQNSKE